MRKHNPTVTVYGTTHATTRRVAALRIRDARRAGRLTRAGFKSYMLEGKAVIDTF